MNAASNAGACRYKRQQEISQRQRQYALLCLDRLKAIVEHAHLSDRELMSLCAEVNEIYSRHVSMPDPIHPDDAKEFIET
jgi:hypothetical protein